MNSCLLTVQRSHGDDMRAYHFLAAQWALDDSVKRRIKLSEIGQTNDPFELWCISQPSRELREALRAYKKEMNEKCGLICFSESWVNPLLWSHYADKHRGICLGFDMDDRILRQVKYVKERSPLKLPLSKETADQLLWTKYWRSWLQLDERENGHYFYHFDTQSNFMRLREVIAGPLCGTREMELKAALGRYPEGLKIVQARLAFNTLRVVEKRDGF